MDPRLSQPRSVPTRSPGCAVSAVVGLSLLLALPAQAARYDAICGQQRCRIEITDRGVQGPGGLIPADRIVQWNALGWKNHSALVSSLGATGGALTGTALGAVATCWTLIACPFGILAGAVLGGVAGSRAGKTADYRFSVEGFDASGRAVTESFRFINAQPVPELVKNLTKVSGLEMAERREVAIAAPQPRLPVPRPQPLPPRRPSGTSRLSPPPPAAAPLDPGGGSVQGEMPILYDAIDPYQGTPLFP